METIALSVLGAFLAGVGAAHLHMMKKLNTVSEKTVTNGTELMQHDRDITRLDRQYETVLELHRETLNSMTKIIDQNNLLIQQIIAHNGLRKG